MNKLQMLESVRRFLSQFGEPDEKILDAMQKIDREDFMPDDLRYVAYEDTAMPIGEGQTISQPSTVARMLSLLELKKGDRALEVGAGSGWNACLIGWLVCSLEDKAPTHPSFTESRSDEEIIDRAKRGKEDKISDKVAKFAEGIGHVLTLEIVDELIEKAREKIKKFEIKNVEIRKQDFRKLDEKFDKIIFTAGILHGQENVIEDFAGRHLEENGILVCPYRSGRLIIMKKKEGEIKKDYTREKYVFVELVL